MPASRRSTSPSCAGSSRRSSLPRRRCALGLADPVTVNRFLLWGYVRHRDGVTYRYNNLGFREEADLGAKEPGEFRAFFMGGSAVYGGRASEKGVNVRRPGTTTAAGGALRAA
jgi:hypothetical protein